nr:PREDICTED: piggyBac transposable element-derived protein 4-like [Megachile rotundata]
MLHFNNNNVQSDDPLIKIRPIIDTLKNSFSQSFYPYKDLCIDESLMLFKGWCYFKQFIPSKRCRFGIKSFILCDCTTNYVLDFIVYTGKNTDIVRNFTTIGQSADVVMTLLHPYLEKGHTLITDNWYTSPHLYNVLHKHKTNAFGTVRKNRRGMPHMEGKLTKGQFDYRCTDNLLALKWRYRKNVWMLSSAHEPKMIESGQINYFTGLPKLKPECVVDYNIKMGSADHVDMVLIIQILQKYPQNRKQAGGGRRSVENLPFRLTERHFPSKTLNAEGKSTRRKCVVCRRWEKRKDTPYECKKCDVGLCVDTCFEVYHTQMNY